MSVVVSLDVQILSDDQKIYKYFPGKDYKFHAQVRENKVAIIDVLGLDELGDNPSLWSDRDIRKVITKDRIARLVAAGGQVPSRQVHSKGDKAKFTFLKGLFLHARKGDLILMPNKGYMTDVLVGRFLDDAGVLEKLLIKDNDVENCYYGRKIEWIGAVQKRYLNDDIVRLLHSQAAFFDIGRSYYYDIYKLAFDNFVHDGQFVSTFRTSKNIFTPKDNLLSSIWMELIEVLEQAHLEGEDLPGSSLYELVIDSKIDDDQRDDLSISIQSPGWFRVRSLVATPLVSIALFAMAASGLSYSEAAAATITTYQMQPTEDGCLGDVDEAIKDYIELLGASRWEEACRLVVKAQAEASLYVKAEVTKEVGAEGEQN